MKKWQCQLCDFIYDEAAGFPEEGIAPGTRWKTFQMIGLVPIAALQKKIFR